MSYTTTAPERSADRRPSRLRSLLSAFDRHTLKTMNVPAELGGLRPEHPASADRDHRS